jgi:hypothetical protein
MWVLQVHSEMRQTAACISPWFTIILKLLYLKFNFQAMCPTETWIFTTIFLTLTKIKYFKTQIYKSQSFKQYYGLMIFVNSLCQLKAYHLVPLPTKLRNIVNMVSLHCHV